MNTPTGEALILCFVMGAVIFFCRAFPFVFFRKGNAGGNTAGRKAFLDFVEKTVPPAAMAVLAFNSISGTLKGNPKEVIPVLAAAAFTALMHLWRRNPLISIIGGTALYMILERLTMR